jgi:hypothetical protein
MILIDLATSLTDYIETTLNVEVVFISRICLNLAEIYQKLSSLIISRKISRHSQIMESLLKVGIMILAIESLRNMLYS